MARAEKIIHAAGLHRESIASGGYAYLGFMPATSFSTHAFMISR
jgi:hypothetical protein